MFTALQRPRSLIAPAQNTGAEAELYGILLRREACIAPAMAAALKLDAGERVSAREGIEQSALFYPNSDGYEYLSPADASELTPESLRELLSSRAQSARGPKLVYGFDQYYAAYYSGGADIGPGPCRVRFEGFEHSLNAELISVSRSGDECAVLLRLMTDCDSLGLRLCRAELIY